MASVEVIGADDVSREEAAYFVEREGRGQSIDALQKTIREKGLSMVLLAPSYGAELGCVCVGAVCGAIAS